MQYRFYKDDTGWYIDIPGYPGTKASCKMVAGADVMLHLLSNKGTEITLEVSNKPIKDNDGVLTKIDEGLFVYGETYQFENIDHSMRVWLCPVTRYVFKGIFPKTIYVKIVKPKIVTK